METTTEIKAKVIAQYIGHMCQTMTRAAGGEEGKPFRYLKGQLKEIDMGMVDSFMGVLLENEPIQENHENYNTKQCKLILKPLSAITDEDALEIQRIYDGDLKLHYETNKINRGKKFANDPMLCYEAYQYLISKGYDIKHRLLGHLTLQQAGLAHHVTRQKSGCVV